MTDAIDRQNAEFDTLTTLAREWKILQGIAVVDDDYPAYRARYETALQKFITALGENGRFNRAQRSRHPADIVNWCQPIEENLK